MGWARLEWHILQGRALVDGIITTRPGGPASLLDLSPVHFLAYAEAVLRSFGEEVSADLDNLYETARPAPAGPEIGSTEWHDNLNEFILNFS
jgi:hypothetical protein